MGGQIIGIRMPAEKGKERPRCTYLGLGDDFCDPDRGNHKPLRDKGLKKRRGIKLGG